MTMLRQDAIGINIKMTVLDCPACGMVYGITSDFEQRRRNDGKSFYCPNGHSQVFRETEAEVARKEAAEAVARMEKRLAYAERLHAIEADARRAAEGSLRATKGVVTKMRQRTANGVCPCCTRHFTNLQRHIAMQHPEYAKDDEATPAPAVNVFTPVVPKTASVGPNPSGLCQCGCGQRTSLATQTDPVRGYVKGQPMRYRRGHHVRKPAAADARPDEGSD